MPEKYTYHRIPRSRIASFDVYAIGLHKHHVPALLEFDVTESRKMLRAYRRNHGPASFNAWLVKVIGNTLAKHTQVAAFLISKKKMVSFNSINISIVVEKELEGERVPIPLLIEHVGEKSITDITREIEQAKQQVLTKNDVVLQKAPRAAEQLYYLLPGALRRMVWRIMLRNPKTTYRKMGNAVITSLSMFGKLNGWFLHRSVHPVSFGIGAVLEKAVVKDGTVQPREMLNMTILLDHDVVDGAPMVRFLNDLAGKIEQGEGLQQV